MNTRPILEADLGEVGQFLNAHLSQRIAPKAWSESLTAPLGCQLQPNYGMQLLEDGRIVGVFCAIYSDQVIKGQVERFCNPHSWCVLESHRRHSIGLDPADHPAAGLPLHDVHAQPQGGRGLHGFALPAAR
jgi:hypothetical protein